MPAARLPANESQRLAALERYRILDTLPEAAYDDITLLASRICGTPIAAISLVDAERQWFKSKQGLDVSETSRDVAFCAHSILKPEEILEVCDATNDRRFADNPLVVGEPGIRFYAGAPLVTSDEMPIGTLCVIDQAPRALSAENRESLMALARLVMGQLELRVNVGLLEKQTRWLEASRSQIQQKQRELDASRVRQLELKDQLLRHVSHELRTPLAALHQFLSLLIDDVGEPAEQRQYLDLAFKSSQQLRRMISDLLEVARAESGKLRIDTRLLTLPPLIHEVVESSRECAAAAGLSITADVPTDLPIVLADAERTRQLLDNLVGNAIKFTPDPGSIRITARVDADDPEFIRCSVTDSGCGIAEESQQSVFDQFHQESNQHASSREGLGVGLAICRSLVMRMGGRIWVESKLGAGSTFHFTIPIFGLETLIRQTLSAGSADETAASAVTAPGTPRDLALIRVSLTRPDGCAPPLAEPQARRVRHLIEGLLYFPETDQLLPDLGVEASPGSQHVLVATNPTGLRALVRRLGENLNLDPEIRLWKLRVQVEGVPLRASAHDTEATQIAAGVEALIQTNTWKEGIRHEQVQGDDRR